MSAYESHQRIHGEDNRIQSTSCPAHPDDPEPNCNESPLRAHSADASDPRATNNGENQRKTCSQLSPATAQAIGAGSSEGRTAELNLLLARSSHNSRILPTKSKSPKNFSAIFNAIFGEDKERPKELGTLIRRCYCLAIADIALLWKFSANTNRINVILMQFWSLCSFYLWSVWRVCLWCGSPNTIIMFYSQ